MYNVQILMSFPILVFGTWLLFTGAAGRNPMENENMFEGDIAGIYPEIFHRSQNIPTSKLWPGAIVFYEIDPTLDPIRGVLYEAMNEFQEKSCIIFQQRSVMNQDYIKLRKIRGCWSFVGQKGGMQPLSLDVGCLDKSSIIHELAHALGLWHEHSRPDRDAYLYILWGNILPGYERNFVKRIPLQTELYGDRFDYNSIMLYDEYAYSKDDISKTIKPKKEGVTIGSIALKDGLSENDARRINKLYGCWRKWYFV